MYAVKTNDGVIYQHFVWGGGGGIQGCAVRVGNAAFVPFSIRKTGLCVDKCCIFWPLFAGFSLRRPGLDALADLRDLGVDKYHCDRFFSDILSPLHQLLPVLHIHVIHHAYSVAHYSSTIRLYSPDADCGTE
jgi:hypothetical protein